MKLNPQNSVFGAAFGKFLGFLVSRSGVEANSEKIQAVLDMRPPTTVKDVQKLVGRVASLRRFVPKSANKCTEFFKFLQRLYVDNFHVAKAIPKRHELDTAAPQPKVMHQPLKLEPLLLNFLWSSRSAAYACTCYTASLHDPNLPETFWWGTIIVWHIVLSDSSGQLR